MTATDGGHRHDDHLYDQAQIVNEDVQHEHSDVNVRAILAFAAGMIVLAAIIHVSMWALFEVFERQAADNDPVLSPLAQPAGQLPPEPRLLIDEPQNLQRFRSELADQLKGIDDAKKQLLQQGLPVRSGAPTEAWMGTHSPAVGESSGGRAIPVRPGGVPAPASSENADKPVKSGTH